MSSTKKILLLTIVIFLVGITLNLIFKKIDNKNYVDVPQPVINNPSLEETTVEKISVNTELPSVPEEMAVYNSLSKESAKALVDIFSQKFQLNPNPTLENIWIDSTNKFFLSYSPISDQITFSDLKAQTSQTPLDKETSVAAAKGFIDLLELDFQVEIDEDGVESSTEYGYAYIVPFAQKIGKYNLYLSSKLEKTIKIFITNDHKVTKVVINNPSLIVGQAGYSKTLSEKTVISAVKKGEGNILKVDDGSNTINTYENIKSIDINKIEVEYREDSVSKLVIPYYRLQGNAVSIANEPLTINIVYPVIKTQK